jgi:ATP-dependent exoDNAse (exonuclease V) beta subunit
LQLGGANPWIGPVTELKDAKKAMEQEEKCRVAYVAATRAKKELWLVAAPENSDCALGRAVARHDSLVTPITSNTVTPCHDYEAPAPDPSSEPLGGPDKQAAQAQRTRPKSISPSQIDAEQGERRGGYEGGVHDPEAVYVGELVHAVLEHMDFARPLPEQVEWLLEAATAKMHEELPADVIGAVFERAAEVLTSFARSGLGERIQGVELLARELPFTCPATWLTPNANAVMGTGFIDLVYRDPNGVVVVADWKVTSNPDHAALRARYSAQLAAYANVIRPLLPDATIRAELLLVRSGETVPIPLPP